MIGCDWFSKYILGKSNADGLIDVYTLSGLHRGLNARYNQIICIILSMKHDREREREREQKHMACDKRREWGKGRLRICLLHKIFPTCSNYGVCLLKDFAAVGTTFTRSKCIRDEMEATKRMRVGEWESGRVEEWKSGRVEEWKGKDWENGEWECEKGKNGRVQQWDSGREREWSG